MRPSIGYENLHLVDRTVSTGLSVRWVVCCPFGDPSIDDPLFEPCRRCPPLEAVGPQTVGDVPCRQPQPTRRMHPVIRLPVVPDTNIRIHPHTFVSACPAVIVVVCVNEAALGRLEMRRCQTVRQPAEVQPVVKRRGIHSHQAVPTAADRHGRSAAHSVARCRGPEKGPVDRERRVPVAVAQRKGVVEHRRDGCVQRTGGCVVAPTRVQQGQHIGYGKSNVLDEHNLIVYHPCPRVLLLAQRLQHRVAQARQIGDPSPVALATGVRHPSV
ncbi:uncharacterized protein SPSK_09714 [Sporothrix schenckii 1099-18]|uniref:Uncharacterized protein n=1 Tax=Sporothrix schenckii 1099-18 TaxID=1397361 RepID=A0A0F2M626_SPOSC|nr:uncharacterized protein SPSK_09714 [Sporothrix schenckii 1099-18]KJR85082.1 hypothetical protein SPSK_09714 [Sporothrix schenckii 1099-18]